MKRRNLFKAFSRIISFALVLIMLIGLLPINAVALTIGNNQKSVLVEEPIPEITVSEGYGTAGSNVVLNVNITNNPGIATAKLVFKYNSALKLTSITEGSALEALDFTAPGKTEGTDYYNVPTTFLWDSISGEAKEDGIVLTLNFKIPDDAEVGYMYTIDVACENGDITNEALVPIEVSMVDGLIEVLDYQPGDVNNDGKINGTDVTFLRRYITGGYGTVITEDAADVNGDGKFNGTDVTLIRRYIAGGYGVLLKPALKVCDHTMSKVDAKAATCTEDGNVTYWYCEKCDKAFTDETGLTEASFESIKINATGHTVVIDPAIPATSESWGKTEGSHCSVCDEILIKQEDIPPTINPTITYNISNNDPYLAQLNIENTNPSSYNPAVGLTLSNLKVDGYIFDGWYDGEGANGELVKEIPAGTNRNIELYARWTLREYTVQFDSPDVPVEPVTYTVDKGVTLKSPSWFGYTFVGWSKNGKILSIIEPGTTGNITLHANWTSNRNQARSVKELGEPIIIEDMDNARYLFVYEIGSILNVPLEQIKYYGNSDGISISEEFQYSKAVQDTTANTIANVVANATTKTSSWTLSEEWNKTTSATTEHDEQIGKTQEKTDSSGSVVGSKYYVSNCSGGTSSSSSNSGGSDLTSSKVTEGSSTGINGSYSTENTSSSSVGLNASTTLSTSMEASGGANVGVAETSFSTAIEGSITAGVETQNTSSYKEAATIANSRTDNVSAESGGSKTTYWDSSSTSSSTWNTQDGYESSQSTSTNQTISDAISQLINDKYSYSSSDSFGANNSSTSSTGETQETKNEYSSTVEYSIEETTSIKETVNYRSDAEGYYRLVSAGTVHVFAVVGYDIATNSYFTYTYNVLDKERHTYLDYSKDNANFDDCQNGILPFEVPGYINDYITGVIGKSSTLTVDFSTGYVTKYEGDGGNVIIPQYVSRDNGDGTYTAVRVCGINENVFKDNKNLTGIILSKYIRTIPDNAFAGCSNLEVIYGNGVTEIGDNAFSGCTSLEKYIIDEYVESVGTNAFEGAKEVKATAKTVAVADNIVNCGADRITLNIANIEGGYNNKVVTVDDSTEYFAFISNGSRISNLIIDSNATETVLNNICFVDNQDTPIKISSEKITLNRVVVENAPGFAMVLSGENTSLNLFDNINLTTKDQNAVIAKNISLQQVSTEVAGKINLSGNLLLNGNIVTGTDLLEFDKGKVVYISGEEYDDYLTSCIVTFDANTGSVTDTTKIVYYNQNYGELPTPTKSNYTFTGWYTATEGGEKVTADTKVLSLSNQTLYAHWTPNTFVVTYNANGGSVSTTSKTLAFGQSIGTLPTPTRDHYTFNGWYTAVSGGTKITDTYTASTANDFTVYAQWTQKATVGWVKASEVPAGAQIVDRKYTYTLREYTSSSSSTLLGYVHYDTAITSWSAWSAWSTSNPANGVRQVDSRSVYDHTEYHYYRWTNSNYSALFTYSTSQYGCTILEEQWFNYQLPASSYGSPIVYNVYDNWGNRWVPANYSGNYSTDKTFTRDIYRTEYRYQDPIYTYYFYRDLSKESSSDPTGQANVFDTVEWVMYIPK